VALAQSWREEGCNALLDFKPRPYSVTHDERSDSRASAVTLSDCTRHTFTVMAARCRGNRLKDIPPAIQAEASSGYLYSTCDGYDDSEPLSRTGQTSCGRLSEIERLETQSAYFVCGPNRRLFVDGIAKWRTVETSGRNARQQARQLDISPTCRECRQHESCTQIQPREVTDLVVGEKKLEDASNPVRVYLVSDRRDQQPPLFAHYCRHPKQSPAIRPSPACSSPPSFPSLAASIHLVPSTASACHLAPAHPSVQFAAAEDPRCA
jgi:hypothetical protein